jgi:hypothetical protein
MWVGVGHGIAAVTRHRSELGGATVFGRRGRWQTSRLHAAVRRRGRWQASRLHAAVRRCGRWQASRLHPKRGFELMFRAYAPTKAFFDKTWKLPDIEKVAQ